MTSGNRAFGLIVCALALCLLRPSDSSGASRDRSPPGTLSARRIVLPNIVVNEALLERLSRQPAPLPRDLSPAQRTGLDAAAGHIRAGALGAANAQWRSTLESYLSRDVAGENILEMLHYVMKQSLKEQSEDKKYWIQKLKMQNDLRKALSDMLKELADASKRLSAQNGAGGRTGSSPERGTLHTVEAPVLIESPAIPRPGSDNTIRWERRKLDRASLQAQIERVERRLAAAGKDEEMAKVNLQNVLQKRQQALQTLSHVSKMFHDSAMSVIRKIQ